MLATDGLLFIDGKRVTDLVHDVASPHTKLTGTAPANPYGGANLPLVFLNASAVLATNSLSISC